LAVVTAGCAVQVDGTPTAVPDSGPVTRPFDNPDRISAEDALGDLTRWNPCSVIDTDALPDSWTVDMPVPVAFEDCEMSVRSAAGVDAEVQVGYLYESSYDLTEHKDGEREGGITIVPDESDNGACTRDIVFADRVALVVRGWRDTGGQDGVCEISDAVVDVVLDGVMAHRATPLELPDKTIGETDPCRLVTADVVALVPGVTPDIEASEQVSRHSCWWSTDGAQALNIEFEIGKQPAGDSAETIQGRYTATSQYADDEESSLCSVTGEHVKVEFDGAYGLTEQVGVYVYQGLGQGEQACAIGKQVANALWQKLPPL
jgi:hypothetical protein